MTTLAQIRAELPSQQLLQIHPSWIADQLVKLPAPLLAVSCACLPEPVRDRTVALLPQPPAPCQPTPPVAPLFQTELWKQIRTPAYKPSWELPDTPLRDLLTLDKGQLVRFIDILALWELAPELHRLIDKEKLQLLRNVLSREQAVYLGAVLRAPKAPAAPIKQPLLPLLTQPDRFRRALHERGLSRLAASFKASDNPIVWHLSRRLDTGRGRHLESAYTRLAGSATSPKAIEQLLQLAQRVKEAA
jgi:hypothetical protein